MCQWHISLILLGGSGWKSKIIFSNCEDEVKLNLRKKVT